MWGILYVNQYHYLMAIFASSTIVKSYTSLRIVSPFSVQLTTTRPSLVCFGDSRFWSPDLGRKGNLRGNAKEADADENSTAPECKASQSLSKSTSQRRAFPHFFTWEPFQAKLKWCPYKGGYSSGTSETLHSTYRHYCTLSLPSGSSRLLNND